MKKLIVPLILLLVFVFAGCNGQNTSSGKVEEAKDVEYEVITQDKLPYQLILKGAANKNGYSLQGTARGYEFVILENKLLIKICSGGKTSNDYSISVNSIKKAGNTTTVTVEENGPEQSTGTKIVSYPTVTIVLKEMPQNILVKGLDDFEFPLLKKTAITANEVQEIIRRCQFSEGLLSISDYGKYGYFDKTGKKVIDFKYDAATNFSNGLAIVAKGGRYGVIDKSGNAVVECKYDNISGFDKDGLSVAMLNGKYGVLDNTGRTIIDFLYDDKFEFDATNRAIVKSNGLYGVLDKSGKVLIECKYDKNFTFYNNGVIKASIGGKYGLIDANGSIIVNFLYDDITDFDANGLSFITSQGFMGVINRQGAVIIQPTYNEIKYINKDTWRDRLQVTIFGTSTSGVADLNGNVVIPPVYSNNIIYYDNGTALLITIDQFGEHPQIINKYGQILK